MYATLPGRARIMLATCLLAALSTTSLYAQSSQLDFSITTQGWVNGLPGCDYEPGDRLDVSFELTISNSSYTNQSFDYFAEMLDWDWDQVAMRAPYAPISVAAESMDIYVVDLGVYAGEGTEHYATAEFYGSDGDLEESGFWDFAW